MNWWTSLSARLKEDKAIYKQRQQDKSWWEQKKEESIAVLYVPPLHFITDRVAKRLGRDTSVDRRRQFRQVQLGTQMGLNPYAYTAGHPRQLHPAIRVPLDIMWSLLLLAVMFFFALPLAGAAGLLGILVGVILGLLLIPVVILRSIFPPAADWAFGVLTDALISLLGAPFRRTRKESE